MDITPLVRAGQQIIQSYSVGQFKISGKIYKGPVIVFPDRVEAWGDTGNFDALAGAEQDVILFGCGETLPDDVPALRRKLKEQGLNVEIMTTGAACRTYNVLATEGRRVAAALLPV